MFAVIEGIYMWLLNDCYFVAFKITMRVLAGYFQVSSFPPNFPHKSYRLRLIAIDESRSAVVKLIKSTQYSLACLRDVID